MTIKRAGSILVGGSMPNMVEVQNDTPLTDTKPPLHNIRTPEDHQAIILMAGGLAGVISRTCTAPIDRIKVLLQISSDVVETGKSIHVTGVRQGFHAILKDGGWKAFFRGNATNVMKTVPETAARFWAYENMRLIMITEGGGDISLIGRFIAGSSAGLFAQTLIYPLEVVKTRLAVAPSGFYHGIINTMCRMVKYEGGTSLYRGLSASLMGIIPYSGVDFTIYSLLKDYFIRTHDNELPSAMILLGCGALSSSCGQLVSYPLQLTRTRLQSQGMPGLPLKYKGVWDCITQTVKRDGILGLYRGILPNYLKAIPSISISYVVFEKTRQFLETRD